MKPRLIVGLFFGTQANPPCVIEYGSVRTQHVVKNLELMAQLGYGNSNQDGLPVVALTTEPLQKPASSCWLIPIDHLQVRPECRSESLPCLQSWIVTDVEDCQHVIPALSAEDALNQMSRHNYTPKPAHEPEKLPQKQLARFYAVIYAEGEHRSLHVLALSTISAERLLKTYYRWEGKIELLAPVPNNQVELPCDLTKPKEKAEDPS